MTKGEKAQSLFKQGYNCSQSVAIAFEEELGMERDMIAKIVSGFGGGMGRMREVCGCVSGMVFVISSLYGYSDPKDFEAKKELYQRINDVASSYKEINGSIICKELLGLDKKDGIVPEKRTESYYKKRPCSELCKIAGDILENYIMNNPVSIE
ncbi:MAG: C-GCAxxG-C-C family protein [Ruminococcus sp.]